MSRLLDSDLTICMQKAEIERQAERIAELDSELSRLRQHCHKISAEMSDQKAQDRIAELEAVFSVAKRLVRQFDSSGLPSAFQLTLLRETIQAALQEVNTDE